MLCCPSCCLACKVASYVSCWCFGQYLAVLAKLSTRLLIISMTVTPSCRCPFLQQMCLYVPTIKKLCGTKLQNISVLSHVVFKGKMSHLISAASFLLPVFFFLTLYIFFFSSLYPYASLSFFSSLFGKASPPLSFFVSPPQVAEQLGREANCSDPDKHLDKLRQTTATAGTKERQRVTNVVRLCCKNVFFFFWHILY